MRYTTIETTGLIPVEEPHSGLRGFIMDEIAVATMFAPPPDAPTGILSKVEPVSRETRQTRRAAVREEVKALGRRGRSIGRKIAITSRKIRQTQKVLSQ